MPKRGEHATGGDPVGRRSPRVPFSCAVEVAIHALDHRRLRKAAIGSTAEGMQDLQISHGGNAEDGAQRNSWRPAETRSAIQIPVVIVGVALKVWMVVSLPG